MRATYPDGTRHVEAEGDQVILNGRYIEYFPPDYGNQACTTGQHRDGVRDGMWIDYYSCGALRKIYHYEEGLLHGIVKSWYSPAEGYGVKTVAQWIDGKLDGLCEKYDPLAIGGGLIWSATYLNGKLHGEMTYYTGDGIVTETYISGTVRTRVVYDEPEYSGTLLDIRSSTADDLLPSPRSAASCETSPRSCETSPRSCESSPRSCETSPRDPIDTSIARRPIIMEYPDEKIGPIKLQHRRVCEVINAEKK